MSRAAGVVTSNKGVPDSTQTNSAAVIGSRPIDLMPRDFEQGSGHIMVDTQTSDVAAIRLHYRRRVDWHKAEKSLTLQIKAICRRLCDGDKVEAEKLYKAMIAGDHQSGDALTSAVSPIIAFAACEPLISARATVEVSRKAEEKTLTKLGKALPAWSFVEGVRGCGPLMLAQIIGETGDLSFYANPGKVWKRLGLAPYNGKAPSTWRSGKDGKLTAEEWVEIGYSPARRSLMYNLGDCFIKAGGEYKALYDERKQYELDRAPEMTKGHAHMRAHRYIVKRFIRELWKAWRTA